MEHIRVVSESSSFFLLIRSLSVSASRRACWIRACMASGDTSWAPCEFIVTDAVDRVKTGDEKKRGVGRELERRNDQKERRPAMRLSNGVWRGGRRRRKGSLDLT